MQPYTTETEGGLEWKQSDHPIKFLSVSGKGYLYYGNRKGRLIASQSKKKSKTP